MRCGRLAARIQLWDPVASRFASAQGSARDTAHRSRVIASVPATTKGLPRIRSRRVRSYRDAARVSKTIAALLHCCGALLRVGIAKKKGLPREALCKADKPDLSGCR